MDILKDHDSAQRFHHLGFVVPDIAGSTRQAIRLSNLMELRRWTASCLRPPAKSNWLK
jgi:hypothetical protein